MDLPGPQHSYYPRAKVWVQGSKGPMAPNKKNAIFPLNKTIWLSMEFPGPLQSFLSDLDPRTKFLVQGPFGPLSKICNFLTKPHNMGVYGLAWTPATSFWEFWTPGAKFWVQGPLGPKFKNCDFLTKPYSMGVYGLAWTPATIFKVIWTPGPNFWSKGPLAPISKICNFLTKPHNMGVYGITWTPAIILG